MSGIAKMILVALMFATMTVVALAQSPGATDMSKRQTGIADKRAPMKMHDLKMNKQISGQRIPIKQWHAEFSPIGQRRSSVEVRERDEKKMIQPEVISMKMFESKISPQSGRMAYVRNFDQVRENNLVPRYRDAEVVTVQEISVPHASNKEKEISMRDLNRFSFQRNHSDTGGPRVDQAASEN